MKNAVKKETHNTCTTEVSMDKIRIGYPAGYLRFFRIRIGFGYLLLKKIGSGQEQDTCWISMLDFYNDISLRVIQDVTNDGRSVFFAMGYIHNNIKIFLSVCAALITINDNSCYFIISFFPAKWKQLLLYCNAAVLVCCFVCCAEWNMCVLCSLISLFHGSPTSLSSTGVD